MFVLITLFFVFICITVRFIAQYIRHIRPSGIKLELSEFIKMYSAASHKYDLEKSLITYELHNIDYDDDYDDDDWYDWDDDDEDEISIYFSFLDYIRYRIWYNKMQKQAKATKTAEKKKEYSERQLEFLNSVAKDMMQSMEEKK